MMLAGLRMDWYGECSPPDGIVKAKSDVTPGVAIVESTRSTSSGYFLRFDLR